MSTGQRISPNNRNLNEIGGFKDKAPAKVRALGEERARLLSSTPGSRRMLVCHSWLAHAIRTCCERNLLRNFEQDSALDCQNGLLQCFYASMKIKTTPMPAGIRIISLVVRFVFCVLIFPQSGSGVFFFSSSARAALAEDSYRTGRYMAYAFAMKLTAEQREMGFLWRKGGPFYACWYARRRVAPSLVSPAIVSARRDRNLARNHPSS